MFSSFVCFSLNQIDDVRLTTEIEPSVLAMSDIYIAVGFNNRAL